MRKGLISFGENTTATHCGDCPWLVGSETFEGSGESDPWCTGPFDLTNCLDGGCNALRAPECTQAERAFNDAVRVAKIGALRWVRENVGVEDVGYYQEHWRIDEGAIDAEIARLESEGR